MLKLWKYISYIGFNEQLPLVDGKNIVFINRISAILALFIITSIGINLFLQSSIFIPVLSVAFLLMMSTYLYHQYGYLLASKINLMLTILFLLNFMVYKAGFGSGLEFYFLSITVLPFIIFRRKRYIYPFLIVILGSLALQRMIGSNDQLGRAIEYKVFYIVNSLYSGLFIILAVRFYRNLNKKHEFQLLKKNRIIADKNTLLQNKNKELDAFSYYVSHDLQAPLRSITGFSQILQRRHEKNLDQDALGLLKNIQASAIRMKNLVDDLLTLSHSGKSELKITKIIMNEVISNVLKELHLPISKTNVEIHVEDLRDIEGDQSLIYQVFLNVINNAIKYSSKKDKPVINIKLSGTAEFPIFVVEDNGTGFDNQYAERLFAPFQRLHNFEEYEGTGIGLAIVDSIIKKHNGKVWATGKENEGATFYIQLPSKQI